MNDVRVRARPFAAEGRAKFRRGFLYMLLAAILHYFAAGYSSLRLPFVIPAFVTLYLTPLLFLCGFALALYGVYLYLRSTG